MSETRPSQHIRSSRPRPTRSQRGAAILEYVALIGLVVLAGIVVLRVLADRLKGAGEADGLTLSSPSGAAPAACVTSGSCGVDAGAAGNALASGPGQNKEEPSFWSRVAGGARSVWDTGWALGEGRVELGRIAAGKVQEFTDSVYGAINAVEDATGGFPPVQQLGGALKAVVGTAGGVVQVALNPVDAVQGLIKLNNFISPASNFSLALWDTLTSDVSYKDALAKRFLDNAQFGASLVEPYKKDWQEGRPFDALTHGAGDVILSVVGPKGVRAPRVPLGAEGAVARDAGAAGRAAESGVSGKTVPHETGAPGKPAPPESTPGEPAKPCSDCGGPGTCFVAGTPVLTEHGPVAIEELELGARVEAGNPNCANEHIQPDERVVHLRIANPDAPRDNLDIRLLRPSEWLTDGIQSPTRKWLSLDEIRVHGWAQVVALKPPPVEQAGHGCLVRMTVQHMASQVLRVQLENSAPLELTPVHRLYVEGREWTAAEHLHVGDLLRTEYGRSRVLAIDASTPQRVYNLEVSLEHTFRVGLLGVWAHNTYGDKGSPSAGPQAQRTPSPDPAAGYTVSSDRRTHILEGDGPGTGTGHGPRRGNTQDVFPDTWTDDQAIAAIERVGNSPTSTWKRTTGPGFENAPVTQGGPEPNAPTTRDGGPVRYKVRGRDHGLDIEIIVEPGGEGIISGWAKGP